MPRRRLLAALLLLVAIPLVWIWRGSDKRRIEGRLDELCDAVSKQGPESALAALAKDRAVAELFAEPFEVRATQLGFSTRDRRELMRFVHGYRSGAERISMRADEESLSISPELRRATLVAGFVFHSGGPLGSSTERYRVQINWLKGEGEWRIDYVDLIDIVDAPGRFGL